MRCTIWNDEAAAMAQRDPNTAHGQESSRAGRLSYYSNVMCRRGANNLADVHLIMPDVHRGHLQRNNANHATLCPKEPDGPCSSPCSGRTPPIRIPTTTRPKRGQFVNSTSPRSLGKWSISFMIMCPVRIDCLLPRLLGVRDQQII